MEENINHSRRKALWTMTALTGGAGLTALSIPFIKSWSIPDHVEAIYIEIKLSELVEGELKIVYLTGMPVYILKRTKAQLEHLEITQDYIRDFSSTESEQPEFAQNNHRSLIPEIFIAWGMCTHLGCSTRKVSKLDDPGIYNQEPWISGGFFCPCHGSTYDLSGRVFQGMPAPVNLKIPKYVLHDEDTIRIYRHDH